MNTVELIIHIKFKMEIYKLMILCFVLNSAFLTGLKEVEAQEDAMKSGDISGDIGTFKTIFTGKNPGKTVQITDNVPVCDVCICKDSEVFSIDCSGLNIDRIFSSASWSAVNSKLSIEVNFDDNRLSKLTQFDDLPITKLSLRGNSISEIERGAFKNLPKLQYLDLSENNLTQIYLDRDVFEGKFSESQYQPLNLKTLKLGYNQIHSMNKNTFDYLPILEHLELNNNPMEVLDHQTTMTLTTLRQLKTLNLAETGIINIPEGFLNALPELKTLIVNGNRFKTMPLEFQQSSSIEYLNLDDNLINAINEDSFKGLVNLKELSVSSMPRLEVIGRDSFSSLRFLRIFRCSHNPKLEKIHSRAFGKQEEDPAPLQEFYFRANAIETLPVHLLPWESLNLIDIQENPFKCGCDVAWIRRRIIAKMEEKNPELVSKIICNTPEENQGSFLDSVTVLCDRILANDTTILDVDEDEDIDQDFVLTQSSNMNTLLTILAVVGTLLVIGGLILIGYFGMRKRNLNLRRRNRSSRDKVLYVQAKGNDSNDPQRQQEEGVTEEKDQN